jgi:hypothetical protein
MLRRIRNWGDGDWVDYFDKEYLYKEYSNKSEKDTIRAKWHNGLDNKTLKGHGPWPWPVEQSHGRLKRLLRHVKNSSLKKVLDEFKNAIRLWTSAPQGLENEFTLSASKKRFGIQPRWPDDWMREDGSTVKVNGKSMRMSSIAAIVNANVKRLKLNKTPVAPRMEEKDNGRVWYAMRVGLPKPVQPALLEQMMKHTRQRTPAALEGLWLNQGIMVQKPDVEGPTLNMPELNKIWRQHCLIRVNLGGDLKGVDCRCPLSRSRGHCLHGYVCMKLEGIAEEDPGFHLPNAAVGQAELKRRDRHADVGSSGEESNPRPKRRTKK